MTSVRIARLDSHGIRPLAGDAESLWNRHSALQRLVRRHLPGVAASLFAQPVSVPDGDRVDWYSDLAGQPTPVAALPPAQQGRVRARLADRLAALGKLAAELPRIDPAAADLAETLKQALHFPGDDYLYAIDGEPVLAFWGFEPVPAEVPVEVPVEMSGALPEMPAGAAAAGMPAAATGRRTRGPIGGPTRGGPSRGDPNSDRGSDRGGGPGGGATQGPAKVAWGRRLWPLAALFLATVGALVAWQWWQAKEEERRSVAADLAAARAAECAPTGPLVALDARLRQIDPTGGKYPEVRSQVDQELARCAEGQRLADLLDQTDGDCARLADRAAADIAPALAAQDREREPFRTLAARLDAALAGCALADLAAELAAALDAARGDCPALLRLDGRLAAQDTDREPLLSIRQDLDAELALCDLAADLQRRLSDARTDCAALRALAGEMADVASRHDTSREPLAAVRRGLEAALEDCRALDDLEQAFEDAKGDCKALGEFAARLEALPATNPMRAPLRRRLAAERAVCALEAELLAIDDCAELARFEPELEERAGDPGHPRVVELRSVLATRMAECRSADEIKARIAAAGRDCTLLTALKRELAGTDLAAGHKKPLVVQIENALRPCREQVARREEPKRPPPVVEKPAGAEPRKPEPPKPVVAAAPKQDPRKLCPGERPKELAPDMALVFDGSGSMFEKIAPDGATERNLQQLLRAGVVGRLVGSVVRSSIEARHPNLPRRIDVAKDATADVIGQIPNDVDIGLVLVSDCPSAKPIGFFSPSQRGQLLQGIRSINPVKGTPLADGLAKAANMVDGVEVPAVIVVVSDGEESCGSNPCAVARNIARHKPKLTINVVDITGSGAGNCAAQLTGGRVYSAGNAQDFKLNLQRATEEVRGPAECRR